MTLTRRGFMGAAAGAAGSLLLPSWLTFKQRRAIDLTPFCDEDACSHRRYAMHQPFAQGDWVYATDARICVRTTLADAPALGDEVRLPPATSLPWAADAKWKPYPRLSLIKSDHPHQSTCPVCSGKGGVAGLSRCTSCDGDGSTNYDEWNPETTSFLCPPCRGTGWTCTVLCDYCGGKGETDRPSIQPIEGEYLAGHYDHKIRALGDVEYCLIPLHESNVVAFRGDGFEGLLMPLYR